jgi:hypothetical protein
VRLQYQRRPFDGGGIRTFAALGETLFDEAPRVGQQRDALAGMTFAAGVIGEAFAIGGLREKTSQGVFADAARAGE